MEAITFTEHPFLVATVAFVSWPFYRSMAKIIFGEYYEKFAESIHYIFQADLKSALKGKRLDDWYATLRLKVYLVLCIGWVLAISEIISRAILH